MPTVMTRELYEMIKSSWKFSEAERTLCAAMQRFRPVAVRDEHDPRFAIQFTVPFPPAFESRDSYLDSAQLLALLEATYPSNGESIRFRLDVDQQNGKSHFTLFDDDARDLNANYRAYRDLEKAAEHGR